jgi:N4-gp56 family major capsid protein
MADTTVASGNSVQQWADDEFIEYVRQNPLKSLMGEDETAVIQVKTELNDRPGTLITFSLVTELTGDGVSDDAQLMGNEEQLGNYAHQVTIHQQRNGVVVGQYESIKTKIDLWEAAKKMLRKWNMAKLRDLFLARFFSPVIGGLVTYSAATEAQKDAWEAQNNPSTANQRVLFGAAKSNQSGDHSADLANIDGTADDAHQDIIRLLKRMAQSCSPHITPTSTKGNDPGKERFVALLGSLAFRDLQANMDTVHQNADVRGEDNNIFAGGDIKIGNVICKEVPEMDKLPSAGGCLLENVGNGGTVEVEPIFFCGAQALLLAWGQTMKIHMDEWDYQNKRGVAVSEIRGCEKTTFNSYQHGMVTGYVSAVGD